jgi:hypothetical protein
VQNKQKTIARNKHNEIVKNRMSFLDFLMGVHSFIVLPANCTSLMDSSPQFYKKAALAAMCAPTLLATSTLGPAAAPLASRHALSPSRFNTRQCGKPT